MYIEIEAYIYKVLNGLEHIRRPCPLEYNDIAKKTNSTYSTVRYVMNVLVKRGYVEKFAAWSRYNRSRNFYRWVR